MSAQNEPTSLNNNAAQAFMESAVLLSARELSKMLKVAPRTLWRLVSARQIPQPIKIGGNTRWRNADILQWIAAGCPPQLTN